MQHDLDQFGRDLSDRLNRLLDEVKRLRAENERLLQENKELREEVTLTRLHTAFGGDADLPPELLSVKPKHPALKPEIVEFYRSLPEKINFVDFFGLVENSALQGVQARDLMLTLFRAGLLEQCGRRLVKPRAEMAGVEGAEWENV